MSPPAQKAGPGAASITTSATASSASHSVSAASIRRTMPSVSALSAAGRLSVSRPALPSTCTSTSLIAGSEHAAGHDQAHDFVRALEYLVHAQVPHDLFDAVIRDVAVAAEQLQGVVGDVKAGIGAKALGHGTERRGVAIAAIE